jgi:hypothetical protein
MIRRLRTRHRLVVTLLAVVLPLLFLLALAARRAGDAPPLPAPLAARLAPAAGGR